MKKIMKRLLVLAMLILAPAFVTYAQSGTNSDTTGSITISDAITGKTYSAYQILVLESFDTEKSAYTYKVASGWEDFFETGAGASYVNIDNQGYVTWNEADDDETMKAFAQAALTYAKDNDIDATTSTTAESTTVTFTGLNLGYYLVDSSVGALCSLTTTKPNAEATEKNSVPTVDKTVNNGGVYGDTNTASIGDTVNFKTVISIGDGAQSYVLYDTMSEGLTLKPETIKVYLNGEADSNLVATTEYEITYPEGYTFVITFKDTYTATLDKEDKITVKYDATLNEKAVIGKDSEDKNDNKTHLEYGDKTEVNKTPEDITITYTYEFDLVKTDSSNTLLDGAVFKLYDAKTDGNEIAVVEVSEGVYRIAKDGETGVEIAVTAGKVTIRGLANGTYYLEETTAPDGYNKLAERQAITITDANNKATVTLETITDEEGNETEVSKYVSGGLHVINLTGAEMPSTGGMGTILFVVIGSIMMIGCGVLLVAKLRISKMSA